MVHKTILGAGTNRSLYHPRRVRAVEAAIANPARLQDAHLWHGSAVIGARPAHQKAAHSAVVLVSRSLGLSDADEEGNASHIIGRKCWWV